MYLQSLFGRSCAFLVVLVASLAFSPTAFGFPITKDGAPAATIVVPQAALEPAPDDVTAQKISTAARELQTYIRKISGTELPIVSDEADPPGPLILVGRSRLSDAIADTNIPAGLTPSRNEEGFVVLCRGDRLLLAGNDEGPYHGTEYAVYTLLERLGVRWFMPGDFGEVLPPVQPTIEIDDFELREAPDFRQRNWWVHTTPEMLEQERRWKIRNRMNPDNMFAPPGDSSVRDFVADAALVASRPELFARNLDGTVNPHLPNLTNPEAVQIAADKMKDRFRADPKLGSIGIAPDDGLPRDFNPETVKRNQGFTDVLGRDGVPTEASTTEEWIEFVNAVAREVGREFPDRVITTNGYANRNTPPLGVVIEPNISIMFAAIWSDTIHAYDNSRSWQMQRQGQMLRQWCALSDKVWLYNYSYAMLVSGLTPVPQTRKLSRDYPLMKQWGAVGFMDEARNQWIEGGITTKYIRARLSWDADADVEALLDDFFDRWYGAAARPAQRFWDALEEAMETTPFLGHEDRILPYVYTPALLAELETHAAAAEAAANTERAKLHVRVDRLILEHLKHYMAMHAAEWAGEYVKAAAEADAMMAVRKQLMEISPFFVLDHEVPYTCGVWYWTITQRAQYYRMLAAMTGQGPPVAASPADAATAADATAATVQQVSGTLVALMPDEALFTIDPLDDGRFAQWFDPAHDTGAWRKLSTTTPFYAQGYLDAAGRPYVGAMWYRFDVDIPADAAGKPVRLFAPVVETEAWIWVNGRYIGHRRYRESYERPNELDLDITAALKPGQANTIVLRVATGSSRAAAAGGLYSRVFLYSPSGSTAGG